MVKKLKEFFIEKRLKYRKKKFKLVIKGDFHNGEHILTNIKIREKGLEQIDIINCLVAPINHYDDKYYNGIRLQCIKLLDIVEQKKL